MNPDVKKSSQCGVHQRSWHRLRKQYHDPQYTFRDCYNGHVIQVAGSDNVLIENCRFEGQSFRGSGDKTRELLQIEPGTVKGYPYTLVQNKAPSTNVTIRNCYFGGSENTPHYMAAIGTHSQQAGVKCSDIVIEDCTFDNAKFTMLADAYITALETQLNGIKYYKDSNSVYLQYWNAGYNVRAITFPDFVDYYGLDIDDTASLQEFRNTKTALESGVGTYTVTTTTTDTSTTDTSDVNMGANQQPIEIYNDDGVKITITGYGKTQYGSARLTMSVVNLYHKDLTITSSSNSIIVNGTSVNCSPYGEIQSGKTGDVLLEMYPEQLSGINVDDISTIDFKLAIRVKDTYQLKAETSDIYLTVNNGIVSQRVVYTDKENIQKVQQLLTNLGYNSGSTDGVPGKLTNSAILQFEKDHGYAENTDITPELIAQLEQAAQQ